MIGGRICSRMSSVEFDDIAGKTPAIPTGAVIVVAIVAATISFGCARFRDEMPGLPDNVEGWTPAGPAEHYDADTLYDYIDGSAEVYRQFNVQDVLAQQYEKTGSPDIIVDVFDMGSPVEAYGAYHHDAREGEDAGTGNESEYMSGSLAFWKGRFFVSIIAFDAIPETKKAVLEFGGRVADGIECEGKPPEIVRFLPRERLMANRVHLFHTHEYLSLHFFVAEENLLDLGKDTTGVLARYRPPERAGAGTPYTVILVRYESATKARAARDNFVSAYMPDAGSNGVVQTEDGLWTGISVFDGILAVVFDGPSKAEVDHVLEAAAAKKKNETGG